MRFKILALFAAIQIISFGLWNHLNSDAIAAVPVSAASHAAAYTPFSHVHFSSQNTASRDVSMTQENLQKQIFEVFSKLPEFHTQSVNNIILDYNSAAHRGLGGQQMIILRTDMDAEELIGVMIHELGHNVDLIALQSSQNKEFSNFKDGQTPIYTGDASLDFYRISWENELTRKRMAGNLDFVSGYAMTDSFEDFAETYAYYVLHGNAFRAKVSSSSALYAKYRFMKYRVFDGQEFETGNTYADANQRPWDVTVMPYNLNSFLGI